MVSTSPSERHYRVVRYYPHFGHGLIMDILGENLSFEEARKLFDASPPEAEDEDVTLEDQNKNGADAEILNSRGT